MRIPLFRIWYSTTYTALLIILLLFLAVTPGDTIYQAIKAREIQKLFVIGGVYLLTGLIVLLIYSTRIYTNRTVLAAIPKSYVPVEEGEVGKGVRRMVVKHFKRSAVIAWDSRPRDLRGEVDDGDENEDEEKGRLSRPNTGDSKKNKEKAHKKKGHHSHHGLDATIIPVCAKSPPWGHISHPGWASPSSPDLPNLQYWSVICELPNLIEAKAVSLAPPDPALEESVQYPDNAPPLPDARIVTLLQRPRAMGLREYLSRLAEFGLLTPPSLGPKFLAQYEYARFSTAYLTETQFRELMAVFAEILNGMTEIDPVVIEEARAQDFESDTSTLATTESSLESSVSSQSQMPYRTPQLDRKSTLSSLSSSFTSSSGVSTPHSPQTVRTAPSRQPDAASSIFGTPSQRSLARSESDTGSVLVRDRTRRSPSTILPNSSESSLGTAGSVIRLNTNSSHGELPYQYNFDAG